MLESVCGLTVPGLSSPNPWSSSSGSGDHGEAGWSLSGLDTRKVAVQWSVQLRVGVNQVAGDVISMKVIIISYHCQSSQMALFYLLSSVPSSPA